MKIASFNIRSFRGMDNNRAPEKTFAAIRLLNADLIGLQEVRKLTEEKIFPLEDIAGKLGMRSHFCRTVAKEEFDYGIGLLSKYPFSLVEELFLPTPEGKEKRAALIVKIHADSGDFYFINTHLSSRNSGGPEARKEQMIFLLKKMEKENLFPAILLGDLNSRPDSEVIALLREKADIFGDDTPTFPAGAPNRKLDYIAGFPKGAFCVENHQVIHDPSTSDHRPILAEITKLK